jgi:hypothetical protein
VFIINDCVIPAQSYTIDLFGNLFTNPAMFVALPDYHHRADGIS